MKDFDRKDLVKKDFGREEITHHREALDVFSKDSPTEKTMQKKSYQPVHGMQLFKKKKQRSKARQKKLQKRKEDLSDKIMKEEGTVKKKKFNPLDAPVVV